MHPPNRVSPAGKRKETLVTTRKKKSDLTPIPPTPPPFSVHPRMHFCNIRDLEENSLPFDFLPLSPSGGCIPPLLFFASLPTPPSQPGCTTTNTSFPNRRWGYSWLFSYSRRRRRRPPRRRRRLPRRIPQLTYRYTLSFSPLSAVKKRHRGTSQVFAPLEKRTLETGHGLLACFLKAN